MPPGACLPARRGPSLLLALSEVMPRARVEGEGYAGVVRGVQARQGGRGGRRRERGRGLDWGGAAAAALGLLYCAVGLSLGL
eukprot:CAMPEP_0171502450 /NCGR_PEP_ID=MMETSP0958-20121227/10185_1 /TAXON_ID=87120 /ORGANISM="Aurantiochytrium limacinum, Strain ATCCMYA-1381" /LENGTH=81 /DNA_ID=CAMNT_0012037507 /DNA_START=446 /DNA_END=692 /DNA_ORIENTATION=-